MPEHGTAAQDPRGVRLQKVLARAGVASRRAAEELIAAGRVEQVVPRHPLPHHRHGLA